MIVLLGILVGAVVVCAILLTIEEIRVRYTDNSRDLGDEIAYKAHRLRRVDD